MARIHQRKMTVKHHKIKAPSGRKSTVTLVAHVYDREETKKTRTIYLGSFSKHLDPATLDGLQGIGAGQQARGIRLSAAAAMMGDGVPFSLDASDIAEIRAWLLAHGSAERDRRLAASLEAGKRALLASEIEAELRSCLESELRAEFAAAKRADPITYARDALRGAGEYVVEEVRRLKLEGSRSTRGVRGRAKNVAASPLDRLIEQTKLLRCDAFEEFEDACKTAGVMTRRSRI